MTAHKESVARAALDCFAHLPSKCKPWIHPDGRREWTPMSAIVVSTGIDTKSYSCVSLATGTKCIAADMLPRCRGTILHDSHAEVLAMRGLNRWLLQEIEYMLENPGYESSFLRYVSPQGQGSSHQQPFVFHEELRIHLFSTEAPCGDASMELLMQAKGPEDSVPWPIPIREENESLCGRGHFSMLGVVRRKPGRGDADQTLSKSCSDKIAMKQLTGLLAFPVDIYVERSRNAFISSVVTYTDKYTEPGFTRAFGRAGRLKALLSDDSHFFDVHLLPPKYEPFSFERASVSGKPTKPSNLSALWVQAPGKTSGPTLEVLINGVKQGFKQFDSHHGKQSCVCRRQMWLLAQKVHDLCPLPTLHGKTYLEAKSSPYRLDRVGDKRRACATLEGWKRNVGDHDWGLDDWQTNLYGDVSGNR